MQMRLTTALGALAVFTLVSTTSAGAQESRRENAFTWSGVVPNGRTLFVKNVNGTIDVDRSTTGRVEVTAEKRWRRGDPEMVRIEQRKSGDNVIICALTENATCDEDGIHTERRMKWNDRNDVSVRFVVRVPDGVRLDLSTVNGSLAVRDVGNEVRALTVNGDIIARSAGGPVRAKTVNGSIQVAMGSQGSAEELEYETVNGSITLELPSAMGAQLELSTVNGRISTDFPITVSGTLSPRRMRGTIGDGRARLRASTVNGSVTLKKSN